MSGRKLQIERQDMWVHGSQHNWNQSWLGLVRWGTISAFKMSLGSLRATTLSAETLTPPPLVPFLWIMDTVTLPISSTDTSQYYLDPTEKQRFELQVYTEQHLIFKLNIATPHIYILQRYRADSLARVSSFSYKRLKLQPSTLAQHLVTYSTASSKE